MQSHPVGINGQNHTVFPTPMNFLPLKEFEKRQKSFDSNSALALSESMSTIKSKVIENKKQAKELKEKGNIAFCKKKLEEAEKLYSEAIKLNPGSRPLWTNRGACGNTMKKYEEAISDCNNALSIDRKCTRSITQKSNALIGLGRLDEAKDLFESLRSLGENTAADDLLKRLHDIQDKILSIFIWQVSTKSS